jgi:rRNA maturation endonuclease Nob1
MLLKEDYLNLCNNIYYTYQLFVDSTNKIKYFEEKLEKIKSNFIKHKKQIPLIKGDDYEKEKQMIEEIGLKDEEDKEALEQLIDELNSSIQEQKDEKGKRIFKAVVDGLKFFATL